MRLPISLPLSVFYRFRDVTTYWSNVSVCSQCVTYRLWYSFKLRPVVSFYGVLQGSSIWPPNLSHHVSVTPLPKPLRAWAVRRGGVDGWVGNGEGRAHQGDGLKLYCLTYAESLGRCNNSKGDIGDTFMYTGLTTGRLYLTGDFTFRPDALILWRLFDKTQFAAQRAKPKLMRFKRLLRDRVVVISSQHIH